MKSVKVFHGDAAEIVDLPVTRRCNFHYVRASVVDIGSMDTFRVHKGQLRTDVLFM